MLDRGLKVVCLPVLLKWAVDDPFGIPLDPLATTQDGADANI